jgi:hypothetical protein
LLDTSENALTRHTVKLHVTSGWQKRKTLLNLPDDRLTPTSKERLEPPIVPKLLSVLPD